MRLLESREPADGKFYPLRPTDDPPPYAILSHTWGLDEEEVTYEDLISGTGTEKAGYEKLRFCARQARQDGLDYFWVDTCCILKANHSELSESINSMFRWYKNAERCYVYLSGLSQKKGHPGWEDSFRAHRWFTRGWTLQELVAARSVHFFNGNGYRLGSKRSLKSMIHEITGISVLALQGTPLTDFDAEERFKWAESRQTKKKEDWAYSLLGIFNVSMPIIYGEGLEHAVARLKNEISQSAMQSSSLATRRPPVWLVPFDRNSSFTGREEELLDLYQRLWTGKYTSRVAVAGLGGVGKTHLVLELLHRREAELRHCSVIWIPAVSKESLEQGYLNAARKLGIPNCDAKDANVRELVRDYLSYDDAGQWLLIIDNADSIEMWTDGAAKDSGRLLDFLPKNKRGSIIFTTRDTKAAVQFAGRNILNLLSMDDLRSTELLGRYLADETILQTQRENAKDLVSQLAFLPLAIVQASMYINTNRISLRDYLSLMKDQEEGFIQLLSEDFEDHGRYSDTKNPVAATWLISFNSIRQQNELAAKYLAFMSCIDSKDIPLSMLPSGPSRKEETDAIGTLVAYSFVTRHVDHSTMTLHRLVHLATRNWLKREGQLQDAMRTAVATLGKLLYDVDEVERAAWRSYLPHAAYMLDSGDLQLGSMKDQAGSRCHSGDDDNSSSMARSETRQKSLKEAGSRRRRIVKRLGWMFEVNRQVKTEIIHDERSDKYPDDLRLLYRYGKCLYLDGRYHEAETRFRTLVEIEKVKFGEFHHFTMISLSEMASTMQEQGRYAEAEEVMLLVLEKRKEKWGEDDGWTLKSMAGLALIYSDQHRWDKAERLQLQVLKGRQLILGDDHRVTLAAMHNLASTYSNQERWDEAEQLQLRVLEHRKTHLGGDHPDTLGTMNNLASTYSAQGRWDEAEKLDVQALEARKIRLGEEHPATLSSMNNLAFTWRDLGRHKDAVDLMQTCVELKVLRLGENHPDTKGSLEWLEKWRAEDKTPSAVEEPDD
jgi:tetratricopeptide (TPR) repeat protein